MSTAVESKYFGSTDATIATLATVTVIGFCVVAGGSLYKGVVLLVSKAYTIFNKGWSAISPSYSLRCIEWELEKLEYQPPSLAAIRRLNSAIEKIELIKNQNPTNQKLVKKALVLKSKTAELCDYFANKDLTQTVSNQLTGLKQQIDEAIQTALTPISETLKQLQQNMQDSSAQDQIKAFEEQINKAIKTALTPISETLEQLQQNQQGSNAQEQIKAFEEQINEAIKTALTPISETLEQLQQNMQASSAQERMTVFEEQIKGVAQTALTPISETLKQLQQNMQDSSAQEQIKAFEEQINKAIKTALTPISETLEQLQQNQQGSNAQEQIKAFEEQINEAIKTALTPISEMLEQLQQNQQGSNAQGQIKTFEEQINEAIKTALTPISETLEQLQQNLQGSNAQEQIKAFEEQIKGVAQKAIEAEADKIPSLLERSIQEAQKLNTNQLTMLFDQLFSQNEQEIANQQISEAVRATAQIPKTLQQDIANVEPHSSPVKQDIFKITQRLRHRLSMIRDMERNLNEEAIKYLSSMEQVLGIYPEVFNRESIHSADASNKLAALQFSLTSSPSSQKGASDMIFNGSFTEDQKLQTTHESAKNDQSKKDLGMLLSGFNKAESIKSPEFGYGPEPSDQQKAKRNSSELTFGPNSPPASPTSKNPISMTDTPRASEQPFFSDALLRGNVEPQKIAEQTPGIFLGLKNPSMQANLNLLDEKGTEQDPKDHQSLGKVLGFGHNEISSSTNSRVEDTNKITKRLLDSFDKEPSGPINGPILMNRLTTNQKKLNDLVNQTKPANSRKGNMMATEIPTNLDAKTDQDLTKMTKELNGLEDLKI